MRYHLLLLFSLFTFLTMNTAFAQCRVENVGNNAQVKLVVGEMNGANTLDSWDIRCDSEGDIIEPTTFQPADWKTYLEELARAYRIPANDIQTKLLLRLSTKGVVQKEWTFDMTRDPITVDSGSYQLAANENYRLTVESLIKVNYSEEPIMSRSTIYSLVI